jgi:4-hydroxy-tetrahydrodipicolinate synthase
MITPFDDYDRIDEGKLAAEARYLLQSGVTGIVVGGSMGEGAGFTESELAEAVRITIEAVEGRVPVLAALITDDSAEAIRLASAARNAGAVGFQVPPPHFQFSMDNRVLGEYYRSITDSTGLPLIIYNVVPWAQAAVEALQETIEENSQIIAVKQSGRNIHTLVALLAIMRGKIRIYSALDDMIFPSFVLGVDGTISGTSSVFPKETVEMYHAVKRGDLETGRSLHERITPIWRLVDHADFPSRAKYAAQLTGRDIGQPRRPFRMPVGEAAREMERVIAQSGFLASAQASR